MESNRRKIALDVGDKRIGVAVSDALLITAQGVTTLVRTGLQKDIDQIIALVEQYECDAIVMGLPKGLDGADTRQTEKVYAFKEALEHRLQKAAMEHIEIVLEDERFTTVLAERILIEADVRRDKRKKVIDKQAAVVMLQGYLDRLAVMRKHTT